MIKGVKKHPVRTAFLVLLAALFLFIVYIVKSTSGGDAFLPGDRIAVLEIQGAILSARETVEHIHSIKKNERIKGVVVRINSPGGGVSPSQEIYSELKKLARTKKVVASFSSVAASGGYYIACAAERIVANPGSLTGSIGVIMDFANLQGLLEKLGLKNHVIKSGEYKDIGSPTREMTKAEKEVLQKVIDSVHDQFITAVSEGRAMGREEVRKLADGRVFSGEQAMQHGLVDKLGSLQDSIELVAQMAGVEGEPKVLYLQKKKGGLLDFILGRSVKDAIENMTIPQLMYSMENL